MFDANDPLPVTLTAGEWNLVLGVLHEAPYRIAQPLIQKITQQATEGRPQVATGRGALGLSAVPDQR